jgi:hypothetical protein
MLPTQQTVKLANIAQDYALDALPPLGGFAPDVVAALTALHNAAAAAKGVLASAGVTKAYTRIVALAARTDEQNAALSETDKAAIAAERQKWGV